MAENPTSGHPPGVVQLTRDADRDQSAIFTYTAQHWDLEQAETYLDFLNGVMQDLADRPTMAPFIPGLNNVRCWIAQWENAHYGHRIFFEETTKGITVLRILHTAMNWQDHLR